MTLPPVLMCSMWKTDEQRQLVDRVEHLLAKAETYPALRYLWVVGDSQDNTAQALRDLTVGYPVIVVDIGDTGIEGDDMTSRLRRLSVTGNHYFRNVGKAEYVLVHESDILSPSNVVNLLVANAERGVCPIAAWPTLEIRPGHRILYDVWAMRKDGKHFAHNPPYHACYRPNEVFEVDSFGTCFMFHAEDAPLLHMTDHAVLDLCRQLKEQGRTLYVDPRIEVVQPHSLWQYHHFEKELA